MAKCVILTDDPAGVRRSAGQPLDWFQVEFRTEAEASAWERAMVGTGATSVLREGWRFGCTFSIHYCSAEWQRRIAS